MKKALVLAIVCALGLGVVGFAGPLTGSWSTTFGINPGAASFDTFFTKFDSTVAVGYTVGGWSFGTKSTFDINGFSAQEFTANGLLGAFTFGSTMAFSPMLVTEWTYTDWDETAGKGTSAFWADQTQTSSYYVLPAICLAWADKEATDFAPAFLTWEATGSVSIAGVKFEGLLFLDQSNVDVVYVNYLFYDPTPQAAGGWTQTDSVVCAGGFNGTGWRFTVAGSAGDLKITSRTYFNLDEYSYATYYGSILGGYIPCPNIDLSGVYYIAAPDCTVAFTREYLTIQNFGFGCAAFDLALNITCDGFDFFQIVARNIVMGWLTADVSIKFTVDTKTIAGCFGLIMAPQCFTMELGFEEEGDSKDNDFAITGLALHGFGLTYKFNGVTFTSLTELDRFSMLLSKYSTWSYQNGLDSWNFLVPFAGDEICFAVAADCDVHCTLYDCHLISDGLWTLNCIAVERYRLWEKFSVKYASDACCGGALSFTINTWFGDYEKLLKYGYYTFTGGAAGVYHAVYDNTANGTATYTSSTPTFTSETCDDQVSVVYSYGTLTTDQVKTLFNWAKSDVSVSVGIGTNVTLNLGVTITAFGWQTLDFGFKVSF